LLSSLLASSNYTINDALKLICRHLSIAIKNIKYAYSGYAVQVSDTTKDEKRYAACKKPYPELGNFCQPKKRMI
jgi:hypothetical protein